MADGEQRWPDALLQEVFEALRQAGLQLTLDQYALLRQAVQTGYGLGGWDDLKQICRLLWVKPSQNYDSEIFNQAFEAYVQQQRNAPLTTAQASEATSTPEHSGLQEPAPETTPRRLPQVPPGRATAETSDGLGQVPTAFRTQERDIKTTPRQRFKLRPERLPLRPTSVQSLWHTLRQPLPTSHDYELDLNATVDQILQDGVFSTVVLRPVLARRAELLLLIDDANAMVPYRPALQPLIKGIEEKQITPAQIYRFTRFPDDYLYDWRHSTRAVPISKVLERAHQNRTIALIWSDGGAATSTMDEIVVAYLYRFLQQLAVNVRSLFWLNPLPPTRWTYTNAQDLATILNGRMLHLERDIWRELARQNLLQQQVYLKPYLAAAMVEQEAQW
jgi:uncharacterized protein with von Willebrand factor type A (vWA) domain